jgi:hypothetical protein
MKPSQAEMEALFSQRNIHDILHRSICYQFDRVLSTWAIGAYIRIEDYLNGDYYESKNARIQLLREYIDANSLDKILIALVAATIRSKQDQTLQQVIGYLQAYLPHDDHFDRAKTAGELIAVCAGHNRLFDIERPDHLESPMVVVNHWDTLYEIFETEFEFIEDTFFNPPLVEKPKKVTTRHNCGYHTFNEPVILGRNTQHEDNLDFTTLNILNNIPWVLDPYVISEDEQPPNDDMNQQERANFRQHTETSRRIYNILGSDPFYMGWQVDSRGRVYSHGHHVNLQSYEYKKVMLNFNHYEVITS